MRIMTNISELEQLQNLEFCCERIFDASARVCDGLDSFLEDFDAQDTFNLNLARISETLRKLPKNVREDYNLEPEYATITRNEIAHEMLYSEFLSPVMVDYIADTQGEIFQFAADKGCDMFDFAVRYMNSAFCNQEVNNPRL